MFFKYLLQDPIYFVQVVVIIITSIVIHELVHGLAALSQGDNTPRTAGHMTLNPVVHMGIESLIFLCLAGIAWGAMPIDPAQFRHSRWSDVLVSAAGPCSNLLLAILCTGGQVIIGQESSIGNFLWLAACTNIMLFIFNLLPFPPLDGFHICSEIFPALKKWESDPIAFFGITILFLMPDTGKILSEVAVAIVSEITTRLTMIF